jgi:hypothetical protein
MLIFRVLPDYRRLQSQGSISANTPRMYFPILAADSSNARPFSSMQSDGLSNWSKRQKNCMKIPRNIKME